MAQLRSKLLARLFGKSDDVAEAASKNLNSMRASPEEEAAFLGQFAGEFVDDADAMVDELGEARGFVPQDVQYDVPIDVNPSFGSADDAAKFSVTPAELWEGYLGGDLFAPFRKRLLDRNKPGDPNALIYNSSEYGLKDSFDEPVEVFISPGNQFRGGDAAGTYSKSDNQVYLNAESLDGPQDVFTHEVGGHGLEHDERLLPEIREMIPGEYDPAIGWLPDDWAPTAEGRKYLDHQAKHTFSLDPDDSMVKRYLADMDARGAVPDRQLGAIMSNASEFENFLLELKQQGKLAYGEDFGIDEAANDRMIQRMLSDPLDPQPTSHGVEYSDPDIMIGDRAGQPMQGFELNRSRLQALWDYANPRQKEVIRNGLHRAGAVGGAAVLGGLTDDGS